MSAITCRKLCIYIYIVSYICQPMSIDKSNNLRRTYSYIAGTRQNIFFIILVFLAAVNDKFMFCIFI